MRHNSNSRRSRGGKSRNQGNRPNNNKMQVFDSNGPDVRIRGTAQQVAEKYIALAKDALASDNSVLAQNYLQHAEHYQRLLNSFIEAEERYKQSKEEELALPESMVKPAANSGKKDDAAEEELQTA